MAKQRQQREQEPTQDDSSTQGIDALPQADRASADQRPNDGANDGEGPAVKDDFKAAETEGSVLPYRVDEIDVDSFDTRTDQEILDAQAKERDDS